MTISLCFVCLGNICRSPTAEGVMRREVTQSGLEGEFEIDSAGTGAWHEGERADARSRAVARERGLELTSVARQFVPEDFDRFDYVIAMDRDNRTNLLALARSDADRAKVSMLRGYAERDDLDVPDPYFEKNFSRVFDICEQNCRALLEELRARHGL